MILFRVLFSALILAPTTAGHGAVTSYVIGGTHYPGYDALAAGPKPDTIQFPWESYNPIFNVTDPRMRCNGGSSAALSAPVRAGDNITAVWKQWTHQQGPVMVWLFRCLKDFGSCDGAGKGWFKIDQMGMWGQILNSNNWATAIVNKNLEWSSVIPKNLASGNYLIRHELLSLHQKNKAQFYSECAQIVVAGDGTAEPPEDFLYTIPTYAPQDDPGIAVDIFTSKDTTYTCPGGPLWPGFSASS
ncbi:glycoside hydrolase family 61 protein [Cercophora newfieldiana]|uniref:lytic cellulose monooxygenase (C4-dehydrogenating) n=1 Tax=Cercophora newfieldiana TaxID=92897 RepID=A0AA39YRU2_9PEZI|nr:glycoside hydrolase family 61 protein [Cercophora newfieldiana]